MGGFASTDFEPSGENPSSMGWTTRTQHATFLRTDDLNASLGSKGSLYIARNDRNAFLAASVLPRKSLNRNLLLGFQ